MSYNNKNTLLFLRDPIWLTFFLNIYINDMRLIDFNILLFADNAKQFLIIRTPLTLNCFNMVLILLVIGAIRKQVVI